MSRRPGSAESVLPVETMTPGSLHLLAARAAAVTAGVVVLIVAVRQYGPTIHPDEWGFLLNGQVLLGRDEAPVPTGSFYPAGFGLLTGPLGFLTGSLAGAYRATLIANVALCVALAALARPLARRVFATSGATADLAATLVFVLPGTLVSSLFAWPETAARLAFAGFVLGFHRVATTRTAAGMAALGLGTGLMPALHGRFTLLVGLVCVIFLAWAVTGAAGRGAAVAACVAATAGYAGSTALNRFVKSALYGASYDQENRLLRRLFDPSVWPALLRTMTGQSWYLLATTGAFTAVGAVWLFSRARAEGGHRTLLVDPRRLTGAVVLASTAALIFTGGLQLLYGNRGDHLIYGRYVEIVVPVLVVAGCAALEHAAPAARRTWLVGALLIAVVAFVYVLVDWGDGVKGGYSRRDIVFPNIVGTDAMRYLVTPGLLTFGLAFAAAGTLLWWLCRRFGAWAPVAMTVVLAAGSSWSAVRSVLPRTDDLRATEATLRYLDGAGGDLIGFDEGVRNDRSYYYLRYRLHPVRLVRFDISGPDAVIGAEYSCVYGFPNRPPTDGEWRIVADEVPLQRVLWQRAGIDHC